ncbi:MAG: NADH-quinone oxidoreductase subunit A [Candidatus Heimdallarchaeum aukensis]|uniref:NADH-quinone oxidoreductase subunit A n=1 Tax=Candidatus Heimdallarchaeum aukensis TaxID=2876573 RepID=A0A9Y1BKX5_9ARCH|nr:MAG: NADH-quinone oxidoreductase subunit A [Candidatus Heimdallarchaeum aukensis]
MEEWIALLFDIGLGALVVLLIYAISWKVRKILGSQPEKQSKKKRQLFQSGDAIEAKPRRMYIDTYVFIAYFVLFDVAAFILATVFFITKSNPNYTDGITLALVYSAIILVTLLFAMKKRYPRDVIDPINGGLK